MEGSQGGGSADAVSAGDFCGGDEHLRDGQAGSPIRAEVGRLHGDVPQFFLQSVSVGGGGVVYPVGTDTIKSTLYGRLTHNTPGAGYIHFNTKLTPEFYQQLTSEKKQIRYVKGYPVYEWTKSASIRNEALDCLVYAYAALQLLYQKYNKRTIYDQFQKMCAIVPVGAAKTEAVTRRVRKPAIPTNPFVSNW